MMDKERQTQESGDVEATEAGLDDAVTAAKELIDAAKGSPVSTVRLQAEGAVVEIHGEGTPAAAAEAPDASATTETEAAPPAGQDEEQGGDSGLLEVKAPAVGVFYRRPAPDDPPFTEAGEHVGEDEQIGLIEAMKTYTPVKASRAGVVEEFRAEDEQVVEFEEVLATLRPDQAGG
ncbi:acetyl-CoA carboxylase biotin carboxyl carrier protein [Spirillospora sp. NPDC048911]|uniref:acetyl-CoA carboxylase biotin carboxyl carrier protein n=1 Tax=Spirillospora sp. NPDC048911 TaxID=3364527 RepID=UPI00372104B3